MRYSVTGVSRELTELEMQFITATIMRLPDCTEFTTGAATGVDTIAFWVGTKFLPGYNRICIPAARHNDRLVNGWLPPDTITEECERGSTASESYMNRNDRLVYHADTLLAFPETPTEALRSGTWATLRRARKAGLVILIRPLSLVEGWEGSTEARAWLRRRRYRELRRSIR
jgi:hypothetical protein